MRKWQLHFKEVSKGNELLQKNKSSGNDMITGGRNVYGIILHIILLWKELMQNMGAYYAWELILICVTCKLYSWLFIISDIDFYKQHFIAMAQEKIETGNW